jgi:hypothetical protein
VAVSAANAICAWVNADKTLTGPGKPLRIGAFLLGDPIRSPAAGAYALLTREPGTSPGVVAEDNGVSIARITAHVYAGTLPAAENAAIALANAWQRLEGCPEPCGTTGVRVLVASDFSDPGYVPMPGAGGEQHMYTVSANFMLTAT